MNPAQRETVKRLLGPGKSDEEYDALIEYSQQSVAEALRRLEDEGGDPTSEDS